jgi:hypothetical protein
MIWCWIGFALLGPSLALFSTVDISFQSTLTFTSVYLNSKDQHPEWIEHTFHPLPMKLRHERSCSVELLGFSSLFHSNTHSLPHKGRGRIKIEEFFINCFFSSINERWRPLTYYPPIMFICPIGDRTICTRIDVILKLEGWNVTVLTYYDEQNTDTYWTNTIMAKPRSETQHKQVSRIAVCTAIPYEDNRENSDEVRSIFIAYGLQWIRHYTSLGVMPFIFDKEGILKTPVDQVPCSTKSHHLIPLL